MRRTHRSRRQFIGDLTAAATLASVGASGLLGTSWVALAEARLEEGKPLTLTPAQTEGPYYPKRFPADVDNDLLKLRGHTAPADGVEARVWGRVLDRFGRPLPGAVVEIWQCDDHGRYHLVDNERGPRQRDENFQGFGRTITDAEGAYWFRTIRPVDYPGRTAHIHYAVMAEGHARLVTQLYVEGNRANDQDMVLRAIKDPLQRANVVQPFLEMKSGDREAVAANFDIVVG